MLTKILFSVMLVLLSFVVTPSYAQDTIISIAVPQADESLYLELIERFESQYPGIGVRLITNPFDFSDNSTDVEERLDDVLEQVRQTDVVLVDESTLHPEATRAGYFLDLTPLVAIDSGLNETDFFPAIWKSYQWDGGIWALPYESDINILLYNPAEFDERGVLYPQPSWGLVELEAALRAMSLFDDDGNVTEGAVFDATNNQAIYAVMVSLLGHGLYDESFLPNAPRFADPRLEPYMEIWADIQRDGLLGRAGFDAPILLVPSFVAGISTIAEDYLAAELPGSRSNVNVNAFAISAGSRNPEAAYELIKFLSYSEDLAQSLQSIPAQQNLANTYFEQFTADTAGVIHAALSDALSVSEMRFTSYIGDAVTQMILENVNARTALERVESEALENLQFAADQFGISEITVQSPQIIELAVGEIALKFAVSSIMVPLPTQEEWDRLLSDFVSFDSEVGHVELDVRQEFLTFDLESIAAQYDCFYLPTNEVQNADLSLLRSLNPLLAADPDFDRNDFVGNVFSQVQRNEQIWGLPIVIQPEVMFYNPDLFYRYAVPEPSQGWTVSEFEDALRSLRISDDDPPPFVPQSLGGTYMQVLIAAYGGLAIDYRTEPPTLQFDDPSVIDAARQVLDLAKEGYIQYDGLTENLGINFFNPTPDEIALYNRLLNPLTDLPFLPGRSNTEADRLVTFPQGSALNAVSYDLGVAYISAQSPYAEPCFRLIREVANSPALFKEMPARRTLITASGLVDAQGSDAVDFYLALDQLMSAQSTILIPTPLSGGIESASFFLSTLWLNRAFDRYVFDDLDLELELHDAQQYADEFLACTNSLELAQPVEDDFGDYIEKVLDCAINVDPSFEDLLSFS